MGARYLSRFTLPDQDSREAALEKAVNHRTCYNNYYPFPVFDNWDPVTLTLAPITVLYGGNGSGKTTLLNLMGEKLGLERRSVYNRSSFFQDFVDLCRWEGQGAPPGSRVLTSDDVFDDLLDLRSLNQGVDRDREALLREYKQLRGEDFQLHSLEDYEHLKQVVYAKKKTSSGSAFVRQRLGGNVRGKSNGETAFRYFTSQIREDALYLLDEPENSLSAGHQRELAAFLEDSARFFGCQLILSTHSPFLLAMKEAVVYDLDQHPIRARKWTELENVRLWHAFFQDHAKDF